MNIKSPDLVVRYIHTKNKLRRIVTYTSESCSTRVYHEKINQFLSARFVPSVFTKAYVKNRSIYHNAYAHLYNDYFIMLDVKDFFPSICHDILCRKLYNEINLLDDNQISMAECKQIVEDCSIGNRGLPLGFITSPILSNIYMKDFDCIFYGVLKKAGLNNLIYTRYADDITVSFKTESRDRRLSEASVIIELAEKMLSTYGLHLNKDKTRFYNLNLSNHIKVTGVNIVKADDTSRKLTIGRSIKNKLYWDTINNYGHYSDDQINHIKGMQSFILSIEKQGYETCFSVSMTQKIKELGFGSLKELIDSL